MSSITDPSSLPVRRPNGRFIKGGPGGPGRPRGSVNRHPAAPLDFKRRIAALEARLYDQAQHAERRQNRFQRFSAGLRRFLSGLRA